MSKIAQYVFSVCCASMLCAVIKSLLQRKGSSEAIANVLCGLFLMFAIISPLKDVRITDFGAFYGDISAAGEQAAAMGADILDQELMQSIKDKTEAYIWDKANGLQAQLQVEVTLSDDEIPVPIAVRLSGRISPYAKGQLQHIIENDLGIAKENQVWI